MVIYDELGCFVTQARSNSVASVLEGFSLIADQREADRGGPTAAYQLIGAAPRPHVS